MRPLSKLSCFYYPTTVAIVDDSKSFLNKISLELSDRLAYALFSDPSKAIDHIRKQASTSITEKLLYLDEESEEYRIQSNKHQTKIDLSELYKKVYDANRFNKITVAVTDYSMPSIDGYQFCELLDDLPVRKIMLTGQADDLLATKLFNKGLLNTFIKKESQEMGSEINKVISEQQQYYFSEESNVLIQNLKTDSDFHIQSVEVQKIFNSLCKKQDIAEYYMIHPNGSYLLLDFDAKAYYFITRDEKELHEFCEIAEDQDADKKIIESIKSRKKIPFFPTEKAMMNAEGLEWEKYLFDCEKISDGKIFYYCFIENNNLLNLDRKNILSFNDYLKKEWKPEIP